MKKIDLTFTEFQYLVLDGDDLPLFTFSDRMVAEKFKDECSNPNDFYTILKIPVNPNWKVIK
ncbi:MULTISPECIES: hypothetical protein [unclassified Sphingobacterium]|uniref:hypothetical protein n=1 Tax=unclassified Sphingobacterium TaxID=2609468 RepID=UPI0025FE741E|nr:MULTISPECIES: hypothetical protein [unclassified Sphingobacterium]